MDEILKHIFELSGEIAKGNISKREYHKRLKNFHLTIELVKAKLSSSEGLE